MSTQDADLGGNAVTPHPARRGLSAMLCTPAGRWTVLAFAVVMSGVLAAIFAVHGDVAMTVASPVILIGYALAVTLLGRRSETAALLSDQAADERRTLIQLKAQAFSFNVLTAVLVGGFIVQIARGQQSGTFMWLGAIAGIVYIGSVACFARRG
jgi:hypothetical protein